MLRVVAEILQSKYTHIGSLFSCFLEFSFLHISAAFINLQGFQASGCTESVRWTIKVWRKTLCMNSRVTAGNLPVQDYHRICGWHISPWVLCPPNSPPSQDESLSAMVIEIYGNKKHESECVWEHWSVPWLSKKVQPLYFCFLRMRTITSRHLVPSTVRHEALNYR